MIPEPIKFQLLSADALPQILEIERASFPRPWSPELFQQEFRSPQSFLLGVFGNSALLGYSVSSLIFEEHHLLTVAIARDARRSGLGKALLSETIRLGRERGAEVVFLEVRAGNSAARALYEGLGFRITGVRSGYYVDNQEDAILYTLGPL